ncbi:MAG: hypothetical protein AB1757_24320 [Acidobacteriota bacterium]
MAAMNFQRSAVSSLYFAVCNGSAPNKTVAFLLPTDDKQDPSSLTLDAAWQQLAGQPYAGVFIFLDTTDYDENDFVKAARTYIWGDSYKKARFAWFVNPQAASNNQPLIASVMLADAINPTTYQLRETSLTLSSNFTLLFAGGCPVTVDLPNNQFKIAQSPDSNDAICITSYFGTQKVSSIGAAYLPVCGAQAGCLQFPFNVTDATLDENHLDVALRYYLNDPNSPGNITSNRYPVFNPPDSDSAINAWASLFLLDVMDASRTYFSFNGQNGTGQGSGALETHFRTNDGNKIQLTPLPDALAGFVFAPNPDEVEPEQGAPLYAVPTGAFAINVEKNAQTTGDAQTPTARLMCGLSGVEYVGLMNAANNTLHFIPNQNAFAPQYTPPAANTADGKLVSKNNGDLASPMLTAGATTSWVYVTNDSSTAPAADAPASVQYFAQPDDSVLYEPSSGQTTSLGFMEVTAGGFPALTSNNAAPGSTPNSFPMVPYAGVVADTYDNFQQFELQILSPVRRNTIYSFLQPPSASTSGDTVSRTGTTPQGLLATFDSSFSQWQSLALAQSSYYELTAQSFAVLQQQGVPQSVISALQSMLNVAYADVDAYDGALQSRLSASDYNTYQSNLQQAALQVRQLQLTNVTGALKAALQTNQLFLVISNPEDLLNFCSFNYYQLTTQALTILASKISDSTVMTQLDKLQDIFYASAGDYQTGLLTVLTQAQFEQYQSLLFRYAAFGEIVIQGWTFNLSPNTWNSWVDGSTLLIFKFYGKALTDLAADTNLWISGSDFNTDVSKTQTQLLDVLQDAITRSANEPEFVNFVSNITNPNWNGILALQAFVPLAQLPPQMQGIAAGVDPSLFYAHHIGINITPINHTDTSLSTQDSSLFGLIYYDDSTDLTYNQTDYQFKVLTLKVLFENSAIVSFASQIELYINSLFGELAIQQNSAHGNNILLNGVYQKQGDTESYVFTEQGDNIYKMTSQVLDSVEILKAQFNTVITPGGTGVGQTAQADFIFWGTLHFQKLPQFDVFSFGDDAATNTAGGLSFSNLAIHMNFVPDPPAGTSAPPPTFTFDAGQLSFDIAKSAARATSLYNHFPLKLKAFIQGKEKVAPTDLGFMPIDSPLNLSSLTYPWYGLQFDLNLGSPGGLAAKMDFTASLIAAWSPNAKNLEVFLGIKLPGSSGASKEIPIESVLKLSIGDIEFVVSGTTYMMKFDNIALKFFMVQFPPYGQTNIYLFGDPNNQDNTTLGWYAAYAKTKKQNQKQPQKLLK